MSTLQLNSQGDDVKVLQQQLVQLGYLLNTDGIFGNQTRAAVIKFQNDHHLSPDGIVGPNTVSAIQNLLPSNLIKGVDISHFNGNINWQTLTNDVSFVFCKASQGGAFKDPKLQGYFNALKDLGMYRGVYHFLNFQSSTADEQIQNFLSCGIDFSQPGILPPVLDIEWQVPDTLNPYIIQNRAKCIQLIRDWLTGIATKTGRIPMIYTNLVFWNDYLGNPLGFQNYPLWIAAYQSAQPLLPPGWNKYTIWQNNGNGTIPSINGQVDTDIFNGSMDDLKKLANA